MKLCNFPLGEKVKTSFISHESCSGIFQCDGVSSWFFHSVSGDSAEHRPGRRWAPTGSPAQQLAGSSGAARLTLLQPCHEISSKTETRGSPGPLSQHHKSTSSDSSNLAVYTGKREVDSRHSISSTHQAVLWAGKAALPTGQMMGPTFCSPCDTL